MDLLFRTAQKNDAILLAPRLRRADLQEIAAVSGEKPSDGLMRSIEWSEICYAVMDENDLILALFGVIPDEEKSDSGFVWLLGSDELTGQYSKRFIKYSHEWLAQLHKQYLSLWCYIDARNKIHIRWLQWCGFELVCRIDNYGFEKRLFYKYTHHSHQVSSVSVTKIE